MRTTPIIESDAHNAYVEALVDLLHVYGGDEVTLGEFQYEAGKVARRNYNDELEVTVRHDLREEDDE